MDLSDDDDHHPPTTTSVDPMMIKFHKTRQAKPATAEGPQPGAKQSRARAMGQIPAFVRNRRRQVTPPAQAAAAPPPAPPRMPSIITQEHIRQYNDSISSVPVVEAEIISESLMSSDESSGSTAHRNVPSSVPPELQGWLTEPSASLLDESNTPPELRHGTSAPNVADESHIPPELRTSGVDPLVMMQFDEMQVEEVNTQLEQSVRSAPAQLPTQIRPSEPGPADLCSSQLLINHRRRGPSSFRRQDQDDDGAIAPRLSRRETPPPPPPPTSDNDDKGDEEEQDEKEVPLSRRGKFGRRRRARTPPPLSSTSSSSKIGPEAAESPDPLSVSLQERPPELLSTRRRSISCSPERGRKDDLPLSSEQSHPRPTFSELPRQDRNTPVRSDEACLNARSEGDDMKLASAAANGPPLQSLVNPCRASLDHETSVGGPPRSRENPHAKKRCPPDSTASFAEEVPLDTPTQSFLGPRPTLPRSDQGELSFVSSVHAAAAATERDSHLEDLVDQVMEILPAANPDKVREYIVEEGASIHRVLERVLLDPTTPKNPLHKSNTKVPPMPCTDRTNEATRNVMPQMIHDDDDDDDDDGPPPPMSFRHAMDGRSSSSSTHNGPIEDILAVFPRTKREYIQDLVESGLSRWDIMSRLAEEERRNPTTPAAVAVATTPRGENVEDDVVSRTRGQAALRRQDSVLRQVKEAFPDADDTTTMELLRQNSLTTVMMRLAQGGGEQQQQQKIQQSSMETNGAPPVESDSEGDEELDEDRRRLMSMAMQVHEAFPNVDLDHAETLLLQNDRSLSRVMVKLAEESCN